MVRTQLYLEQKDLDILRLQARQTGETISELVRRAIRERYSGDAERRKAAMRAIVGMWKDRTDLPDTETYIRQLRKDTRWKRLRA